MRSKKVSAVCLLLTILVTFSQISNPVVFAVVQQYDEKELKIVSGSNNDLTPFTHAGHTVSDGFAATMTTLRPVRPGLESFSKAGLAVSLSPSWSYTVDDEYHEYIPHVKAMWIKISGDSNFRKEIHPDGLVTNTGRGGECTVSWEIVLAILEMILPEMLKMLFESPPAKEWQSDTHWLQAIFRAEYPGYPKDILGQYYPILRTAACDFDILFPTVKGYQYLNITAGAQIYVEHYMEKYLDDHGENGPEKYVEIAVHHVGDYSVNFDVAVPVTNEPGMPMTPTGQTSGLTDTSYTYSTATTDPNDDDLRYMFDWGDGSNTTTGFYPSGATASAFHSWSSPGTYQVRARAQDVYDEWGEWSPNLNVTIVQGYMLTIQTSTGGTTSPAPGTYTYAEGTPVTVTASPYTNYEFSYWTLDGQVKYSNPITVTMNSDHTLEAYFSFISGGGCPCVSTWNGTHYVIDNNLLPNSETSSRTDVEDYYRLEQTLAPTYKRKYFSLYSLQISEFENEHSYIDQVKLLAVDHASDVKVAVSPYGEILTYKNPHPPVSCINRNGEEVLSAVSSIDDIYYEGYAGDYLILDFGNLDVQDGAKLVIRADQDLKESIHIQILNETGNWLTVAKFIPRVYWATEIIDLSNHLPDANGDLKVRLCFTASHKLDYVGLDTTPQADITIIQTNAVSAIHSARGDITLKLLLNDQVYTELFPGEQIKLKFVLPNKNREARTFIIYTEGHYETIS